jgi:ABC transport system ATP-binding/permease protein
MTTTLYVNCDSISKSYGTQSLFQDISAGIFQGDKIGLMGPNGAGKSTFMKILAGKETPDEGTLAVRRNLRIAYVPQMSTYPSQPIELILQEALAIHEPHLAPHESDIRIQTILSKIGFPDPQQNAQTLSGGWKKRLDIAQALISNPDLLLLDEPTNHLDLEGIEWLEKFLQRENLTFMVISHDRYFLANVANRVFELNRQFPKGLFAIQGNYEEFLIRREEFLSGQIQYQKSLSSKVRYEQEWLKQSPKARTTKAQSRIQQAGRLIHELDEIKYRNKQHRSNIDFVATDRLTQKLLVAKNLSKMHEGRPLFSKLDFTFSPGIRLGIIGANGTGKTTLLKTFAGSIEPDAGTIKKADGLRIVYFDQYRTKIPDNITLREALATNGEYVQYRGQHIHVNSWCKRFLFSPERLDLSVSQLSGGEKARILIAHLMLQPADILLLDEPTNDLDIPTLEVLEESLQEFPGALALITHDRCMMDKICNVFIGLGVPGPTQLFADFRQWEDHKAKQVSAVESEKKEITAEKPREKSESSVKKLSFKDKFELDQIEEKIQKLEEQASILHAEIESLNDSSKMQKKCKELSDIQAQIEKLYTRWQELENKRT